MADRSINLLADREVILFNQPRRNTPLKQRYVHKNNPSSTYEEFCGAVCNLTLVSGETDADMRVREENLEMRLFSEGRARASGASTLSRTIFPADETVGVAWPGSRAPKLRITRCMLLTRFGKTVPPLKRRPGLRRSGQRIIKPATTSRSISGTRSSRGFEVC